MTLGSLTLMLVVMRACKGLIEAQNPVLLRQLELLDKATTIAAAADLQAYQGVQAMGYTQVGYDGETYDPSDKAEAQREAERLGLTQEDADAEAEAAAEQLRSLF